MQDALAESHDTAGDGGAPRFLARKGVMLREYHVMALWRDGRREKIGRFPCKTDAASWIVQKSAEWLAQYFARGEDPDIAVRPADNGALPSTA